MMAERFTFIFSSRLYRRYLALLQEEMPSVSIQQLELFTEIYQR